MGKAIPMAGQLQHIHMADQIRSCVGIGVLDGIADTGLSPQMHNGLDISAVCGLGQRLRIREITFLESEVFLIGQAFKSGRFQGRVIIII